jgi:uncharacterized protein
MKPTTQEIIRQIRQTVSQVDDKAEVILYGSRARGDERMDSDWDILVLTDYRVDLTKERALRYPLYDLALELEEQFSVFVYSKNEWHTRQRITPFYENVSQEGVLL